MRVRKEKEGERRREREGGQRDTNVGRKDFIQNVDSLGRWRAQCSPKTISEDFTQP